MPNKRTCVVTFSDHGSAVVTAFYYDLVFSSFCYHTACQCGCSIGKSISSGLGRHRAVRANSQPSYLRSSTDCSHKSSIAILALHLHIINDMAVSIKSAFIINASVRSPYGNPGKRIISAASIAVRTVQIYIGHQFHIG